MGGVVRGGVLRALVAEVQHIDAGEEVLAPAEEHRGDHEVDFVEQPGGEVLANGGNSTARRHLDLLSDALMIRQLQPYHANLSERQVKAPKIYVRDSGLLHQLLGIGSAKALATHPKVGASWEGFVVEQVLGAEPHDEAFFWATHQGAKIDLILRRGSRLLGVECKRSDAPRLTPSIRFAQEDLGLERVSVVYPGAKRYRLADRVEAVPLHTLGKGESIFARAAS